MDQRYRMLGFVVIVILYAVIGLMVAAGTILIARKNPRSKAEQIFYAMFLIMIAAFYLAFRSTLRSGVAWRLETAVVVGVCGNSPAGREPAFRSDTRVFLARSLDLLA